MSANTQPATPTPEQLLRAFGRTVSRRLREVAPGTYVQYLARVGRLVEIRNGIAAIAVPDGTWLLHGDTVVEIPAQPMAMASESVA